LKLAQPAENGKSRWLKATEFVGEYKELKLGNGGSWCRKNSTLARQFLLEFDKSLTPGNSIDAIRTIGHNKATSFIETDKRWDARNLAGNPVAYYKGGESLKEYGYIGCYQYDPVEYRKEIIKKAKKGEI